MTSLYRSVTVICFLISSIVFLQQIAAIDGVHQRNHTKQQQRQQRQQQYEQEQQTQLDEHNFLVGIARIGAQHEVSTICGHELEILLEAIATKQLWAIKVIDSFGAAPRSFYWGNYFWFSSQDLCDDLNTPFGISFSTAQSHVFNVTSPFPLDFMVIYMDFKSPHYIDLKLPFEYYLHLGLCLPRSCEAGAIFNYTRLYFRNGHFETQRDFQLQQLQPVAMRRPRFRWDFFRQTGSIIYICTCFTVISLVIIAEILYKSRRHLDVQAGKLRKKTNLAMESSQESGSSGSDFERIILCFRLSENYGRAIALDKKIQSTQSFLSAIAGLRTIICLWVTVFHVYYYSLYAMSNAPLIFAKLEQFALQPIMQACFYVDVFFVMSAFLLVYNFLQNGVQQKQIRQNGFQDNLKLYGKAVLHRYLRLTPVMIITMLLSDMVYDFLNMYSPFRLGENSGIYCKRTWWYNLLYIHNLLDMRKICCSWTWYLACEMQYFVAFTALLYGYAKRPKVTKAIFVVLTVGLVVISWLCNYQNGITFQIDVIHNTLNQLYVKPWVRINPYIGGAITGWILHELQQKRRSQKQNNKHHQTHQQQHQQQYQKHCINTISQSSASSSSSSSPSDAGIDSIFTHRTTTATHIWMPLFWLSCFALYAVTNFMSYWRSTPAWLVAAIMSFGKLLFALFIGGVIVLCALGRGGILQYLLGMRFLQFLNRFCFSIYMLAPVIVVAVFGLRREATSFTEVGSGMDFLAVIVLSVASAFLLVLLVELPMQRISTVLLRGATAGNGVGGGGGVGGRGCNSGGNDDDDDYGRCRRHIDTNGKVTNEGSVK